MKPANSRRKQTGSRKPPSEADVQFLIRTLESFGARPELVPTDDGPTEAWEVWRVGRARQVAVPLRLLDHAAALLDCVPPDCGPPGVKADPAVAEALRIAALFGMTKI